MKYRTHMVTYFLSKIFSLWKLPCLPTAQGITILVLWGENWGHVQASNSWFSLGDNIGFHYKAQIFWSTEAQLVFFEWGKLMFQILGTFRTFEIDHVFFHGKLYYSEEHY